MFTRIMSVVMAAILLITGCFTAVCWVTLRNQQITARLDHLVSEAEDIAYLAARLNTRWTTDTATTYLNRKATQVNEEYGAYIAVVDRRGNLMSNLRTVSSEDPDFVASLSGDAINQALNRVVNGETIRVQTTVGDSPTFTVGVPFIQDGSTEGAVLIQTKAQRIESGLNEMLWKIIGIAAAVLILSGVAVLLCVRSAMKPLRSLTEAAETLSEGNFNARVDETKGDGEIRALSGTFNTMAEKLNGLEQGRREFVANVSHEFRSPITSIKGFAEGMADGVIPQEEHPRYLRLVADESARLSTLVGDLLQLSRLERETAAPDWTVFDINEMLRRAIIRRMQDLDEKNLDTDCLFGEDPLPVRADSDRIEQVIINLLDNAIRFTPENGRIVLKTESVGKTVSVTVADNGPGIAPEDRSKVFDRFFTADRAHTSGKGTGLGLSICKRVMEMHGQSIRLLDTVEGAAFQFTLEKAEDEANEVHAGGTEGTVG